MRVMRKIFARAVANLFFNRFSGNILQFLLLFCVLVLFCFFCFVGLFFFWYTFDHKGGWEIQKISPGRKQDYFFWPNLHKFNCVKIFTNNWLKTEWIMNQNILDVKVCRCLWSTEKFQTSLLEVASVQKLENYYLAHVFSIGIQLIFKYPWLSWNKVMHSSWDVFRNLVKHLKWSAFWN